MKGRIENSVIRKHFKKDLNLKKHITYKITEGSVSFFRKNIF